MFTAYIIGSLLKCQAGTSATIVVSLMHDVMTLTHYLYLCAYNDNINCVTIFTSLMVTPMHLE